MFVLTFFSALFIPKKGMTFFQQLTFSEMVYTDI